jgi:hypothetical protein
MYNLVLTINDIKLIKIYKNLNIVSYLFFNSLYAIRKIDKIRYLFIELINF